MAGVMVAWLVLVAVLVVLVVVVERREHRRGEFTLLYGPPREGDEQ